MNAFPGAIEAQAPVQGPWTPERVEKLKALWAEGKSASVVAGLLSHDAGQKITRSAIIGKIHRLGLGGRAKPSPRTATIRRPRKPSAPKLWDAPPDRRAEVGEAHQIEREMTVRGRDGRRRRRLRLNDDGEIIALPGPNVWKPLKNTPPVRMTALGSTTCRWPVEDGEARFGLDRLSCGAKTADGEPYCAVHTHQSMAPHRRAS